MRPVDRYEFILKWLKDRQLGKIKHNVDCLDSEFVDAYICHTGAKFDCMTIGANRCNQLSRDLSDMTKSGKLYRWRCGVQNGLSRFPKWVWSYCLPENDK